MELQDLQGRVYFLAGQLEEAKIMYNNAVKELEKSKSDNGKSVTVDSAKTIIANE